MAKPTSTKRTPPFSIRLSETERIEINKRAEAEGLSLGGYCKWLIFGAPPRKHRRPQVDRVELARLLGEIGRVGNNLNQLARTLHVSGSVDLPELKESLRDLAEMRAAVMLALGYSDKEPDTEVQNEVHLDDH